MTLEEVAKLLTVAAVYDNRRVFEETVKAWHKALHALPYDVAQEAVVLHFKESTAYLMPGHVTQLARRVVSEREREVRKSRLAVEANHVTLDRVAFDEETERWAKYYREHPDER